jgi:hypothetical protein
MTQNNKLQPAKHKSRKHLHRKKINTESVHVARAAKLIRTICSCGPIYMQPDRSRFRSLAKFLLKEVLKTDVMSLPGKRHLDNSNLQTLQGYELGQDFPLADQVDILYHVTEDTFDSKAVSINFPSFVPAVQITSPHDATHCRIVAVAAAANFHNYTAVIKTAHSPLIMLNRETVQPFSLNMPLPGPTNEPVFVILGISFCNAINAEAGIPTFSHTVKIIRVIEPWARLFPFG